ncbi:SAM-dependent methyltransferase [Methanobrevibacter arboriphilus]|uniref:SAM-dependent methyltransferase n=1 Tax=Methanobrevibacter arboriphilus TaxID=39441 RepID=UPI000AE789A9|nr:SAM-dependent methyltransferase [Methanobrevibacter arboriphilus]
MTLQKGKLFGIGIGPGDYELLTIKALKVLKKMCQLYVLLDLHQKKESIALSIINPIIKKRENEKSEYNYKDNLENQTPSLKILEPVFPMTEDKKNFRKTLG